MKNLCILIISSFIISCSQNPQQIAEKSVRDYLQKNLNDASSYESVEFGKLDSTFSSVVSLKQYQDSLAIIDTIKNTNTYIDEQVQNLKDENSSQGYTFDVEKIPAIKEMREMQKSYRKRDSLIHIYLDGLRNNFKQEFIGFSITHKYRGKNGLGALILKTDTFQLDKNLSVTN